jgi:hypothetical protein
MNSTLLTAGRGLVKKLFGLVTLGVIFVAILALVSPTPVMAAPKCKNNHYCTIEPDGVPSCPPCFVWQWCGMQCGCRPIPACRI